MTLCYTTVCPCVYSAIVSVYYKYVVLFPGLPIYAVSKGYEESMRLLEGNKMCGQLSVVVNVNSDTNLLRARDIGIQWLPCQG